jgi:hypothetical protein
MAHRSDPWSWDGHRARAVGCSGVRLTVNGLYQMPSRTASDRLADGVRQGAYRPVRERSHRLRLGDDEGARGEESDCTGKRTPLLRRTTPPPYAARVGGTGRRRRNPRSGKP